MKRFLREKKGSSLALIIVLLLILGIMGSGFAVITAYHANSSSAQRNELQSTALANSLQRSICSSICSGKNEAMNALEEQAQQDYDDYLAQQAWYDGLTEEEQAAEPRIPQVRDYVREKYVSSGTTETLCEIGDDAVSAQVTITYYFLEYTSGEVHYGEKSATVDTVLRYNGRTLRSGAYLDHTGGAAGDVTPSGGTGNYAAQVSYALGVTGSGAGDDPVKLQYTITGETTDFVTAKPLQAEGLTETAKTVILAQAGDLMLTGTTHHGDMALAQGLITDGAQVNVEGDVNANGDITLDADADAVSGSLITTASVAAGEGGMHRVEGNVYAGRQVTGNSLQVGGSISAAGGVELKDSNIRGEIHANETMKLENVSFSALAARDDVILTNCSSTGTVTTTGNVTVKGGSCGNIYTNGTVTLDGAAVRGNIAAAGGVYLTGAASAVSGFVYSKTEVVVTGYHMVIAGTDSNGSAVLSPSVTDSSGSWNGQGSAAVLCESYNGVAQDADAWNKGKQRLEAAVQPLNPAAVQQPEAVPVLTLPQSAINLSASCVNGGPFSAVHGKLGTEGITTYYTVDSSVTLNAENCEINSGAKVILLLQDGVNLTIEGKRVGGEGFFICSYGTGTVQMTGESSLIAQLYLPKGTLRIANSQNAGQTAQLTGMATVGGLAGTNGNTLVLQYAKGDFSGTGLEEYFGGIKQTGGSGTQPSAGGWGVVKYYGE